MSREFEKNIQPKKLLIFLYLFYKIYYSLNCGVLVFLSNFMNTKYNRFITLSNGLVPPVEEWKTRTANFSYALYGNKIISYGINCAKTHPTNLRNRKINKNGIDYSDRGYSCSELICLNRVKRKTNIDFNKIILVNIRLDRNNTVRNSRPCKSCSGIINFLKPKRVYYTDDNGEFQIY